MPKINTDFCAVCQTAAIGTKTFAQLTVLESENSGKMEEPCPDKFAFAQRSGAMKAPVGLLSDRTVLRQQDGGASPRQVRVCAAERSNERGYFATAPFGLYYFL